VQFTVLPLGNPDACFCVDANKACVVLAKLKLWQIVKNEPCSLFIDEILKAVVVQKFSWAERLNARSLSRSGLPTSNACVAR